MVRDNTDGLHDFPLMTYIKEISPRPILFIHVKKRIRFISPKRLMKRQISQRASDC